MKPDQWNGDLKNIDEVVQRYLPSAPVEQMDMDAARVLQRLRSMAGESAGATRTERLADRVPRSAPTWRWIGMVSAAAAVLAAVIASSVLSRHPSGLAVVEAVDGLLFQVVEGKTQAIRVGDAVEGGKTVSTNGGAGAVLALGDGSRVEMRSQSELSLEHADDGMRVRLSTGSVIVNAAKQPGGHLYVQTKEMTVSVVGTVFLVNAEEAGSRVAVIEGEVRVRERTTETKLRPGEQVSSSPTLAARSVKEEIAWSRQADAYGSILAAFAKGMADTAGALRPVAANQAASAQTAASKTQFEEASIRLCDPDNLPTAPAGARGGGANSFQMTPGRTHALCLTLATIIRHAYGYGPADLDFLNGGGRGRGLGMNNVYGLGVENGKRVRGGPEWVRGDHYTIEAVADGAADAATMSGPMMRELLERRFQLKAHVETEQIPAFSLTIAKSGLKIKPVESDAVDRSGFVNLTKDGGACEPLPSVAPGQPRIMRAAQPGERQPPPPAPGQPVTILTRNFVDVRRGEKATCGVSVQRNGPNQVIVAGGVTLEALGRALASPLGGVTVFDKTGNTDKFNVVLEFVRDENTPGPSFLTPEQPEQPSDVPRGQTIFTAVEDQLGLKLEPAKAPRDFIAIDRVERPSPN